MAVGDPGSELASMREWLVDTGPLVAYLDPKDAEHEVVAARLDAFSGRLVTTTAVVTEAMHFVSGRRGGAELLARFVSAAGLLVFDLCQPTALLDAAALMAKYADTPMDFADATLVLLAGQRECYRMATLDRRGFSTYRGRRGAAFLLVLDDPS